MMGHERNPVCDDVGVTGGEKKYVTLVLYYCTASIAMPTPERAESVTHSNIDATSFATTMPHSYSKAKQRETSPWPSNQQPLASPAASVPPSVELR